MERTVNRFLFFNLWKKPGIFQIISFPISSKKFALSFFSKKFFFPVHDDSPFRFPVSFIRIPPFQYWVQFMEGTDTRFIVILNDLLQKLGLFLCISFSISSKKFVPRFFPDYFLYSFFQNGIFVRWVDSQMHLSVRNSSFISVHWSRHFPMIPGLQTYRSNGPISFTFDRVGCLAKSVRGTINS